MMPSLFLAHGAPTLALEQNDYTKAMAQATRELPRPRAILLFSAHWESRVQEVSAVQQYGMIYDFGGFAQELYEIVYPAMGDAALAQEVARLLTDAGIPVRMEDRRGLDHGAWVILKHLYPQADVPVIAMSVNPELTPEQQYAVGKALSALRARDVLIVGSGGTVHNFATMRSSRGDRPDDWAVEFEEWIADKVTRWDLSALFRYEELAPHARMAVPPHGNEHFVPLFYAMGAADDQRSAERLHISFQLGNLSHVIWKFGKE
ncbi:DODA-type extradiol aromatic ring-opening family dioxygenase [Brevibacillus sp. H7]|uniref:DODA-type extradiol aromatic ring-opening family dioxygenase n=1 Tax=Brevibacillus sp. H7 TaxID=3349138 RepID=UPI0037FAF361